MSTDVGAPRRILRLAVVLGALAAVAAFAWPASAAAAGSGYGQWSLTGGNGTLTVPLAGFPSAKVTTTSSRSQVAGGTSAFLGTSTPFGAAYGSSQGQHYLVLGTAAMSAPSATTVTFHAPTPTGWGFALGDVDADTVRVAATGADGQPVSTAELGWQSAFNYCPNTPRPTGCTGAGPFTDVPRWDPTTATLIGNVGDTSGASGWFRPTVPISSLTLTFTAQTGIPSYQLWAAAEPVRITGRVGTDCGHTAPATTVALRDADGSPVPAADGSPVTTTTEADGTYTFDGLTAGHYEVAAEPSHGYTAGAHAHKTVAAESDAADVALTLTCPVEPPTTVTDDVKPDTSTTITLPDGLIATHVDPPAHGTAVVDQDGTITYTPDAGFVGTDVLRYTARTPSGVIVHGTIDVRVELPNTGVTVFPVLALGVVLIGAGLLVRRFARR
jgi:LPXTG-motif cell wall-anchored protein